MILVGNITSRAGEVLNDSVHTRWPIDELLTWVNEGGKAIVTRRPDAGATTENYTLADGTRQALAEDVHRLLRVNRNMGNGTQPGKVVTLADRRLLEDADPDWHTKTATAVTRQYAYEPQINPREFHVYPPAIAGNKLEVVVSKYPDEIVSEQDYIELPNEFEEALLSYVLFRSFSKDSEYANAQTAAAHYQVFVAALGMTGGQADG